MLGKYGEGDVEEVFAYIRVRTVEEDQEDVSVAMQDSQGQE